MTTGGRHDVRGGGPVPPDGDELIELLYGELPPDEERAVRARVAGDPHLSAQLSELERVRELVRGMPEEEPPSAISAQLMAAAAQAASRRGGTAPAVASGFWSRVRSWFQPIIAHPGLAAACSVVLVAGVAGVLILRQGDKLTPATRTAEQTDPATGMAESVDQAAPSAAPAAESAPGAGYAAGDPDVVESQPDPARPADGVSGAVSSDKTRVARRPGALRPDDGKELDRDEPARQAGPAGGALGMTDKKAAKPSEEKSPDSGGRASTDSAANEEAEEQGAEGSAAPAPPPASAPPAPEPSQTAVGDDSSSSVLDLHRRAVAAAASKRCLEVQSIEQQIRSIDPAYHEKAVLRDKRLAVCLSANKPAKARRK